MALNPLKYMTLIWVKKKLTLTKETIKTHIFKWNFAERSDCYTQFMCERDPNKQLKEKHITQHNIEFKIINHLKCPPPGRDDTPGSLTGSTRERGAATRAVCLPVLLPAVTVKRWLRRSCSTFKLPAELNVLKAV